MLSCASHRTILTVPQTIKNIHFLMNKRPEVELIQWLSNVIRRDLGSAILSILAWSINWLPVGQRELQQLHAEKPYPEGATFLLINLPLFFF